MTWAPHTRFLVKTGQYQQVLGSSSRPLRRAAGGSAGDRRPDASSPPFLPSSILTSPGSCIRLPTWPTFNTSWWLRCFLVQNKEPDWRFSEGRGAGSPRARRVPVPAPGRRLQLQPSAAPQGLLGRTRRSAWHTFPIGCHLGPKHCVLLAPGAE